MNKRFIAILITILSLSVYKVQASHIVGGEMTYKYLGDSTAPVSPFKKYYRYEVSLSIYEDCQNGQPEAIRDDNPAYLAVYRGAFPFSPVRFDSVTFASSVTVPTNFSNACVTNVPPLCLLKKTFIIRYALEANTSGYVVDYQRCCRNNAVQNIVNPGNNGSTYFCYIPPPPMTNNSAVFKNYPPQIICLNNPLFYDNSAFDTDGDSLSYGFAPGLLGATDADIKPWPPKAPPFDTVQYVAGFNSQQSVPGFPQIQIDPVTGLITGTPNRIGRYLVTVYCNEYRDGVLINTVTREFQFVVTDCSKVVIADIPLLSTDPNTFIVNCEDYSVQFINTSKGGFTYHWDFGLPDTQADTAFGFEPSFTYPDTGTFSVKLIVNPGSTCPDSIMRLVKIYPKFHAAFTDSGSKCPGSPLQFLDLSTATIKPVNFWKWNFGDGDSTFEQNPVHTYNYSGVYNVVMVSKNIKNCIDTVVRHVYIDAFNPFAGDDTIIVKGESIQFNATGGTQYRWSPPYFLNDTSIYNPLGYYPDTGTITYYVHVTSPYGCAGYDTIKVTIVNQAAFLVPNAFTPNGDGHNDVFRPVAVGYRNLNYFKVFNRWGQEIYDNDNLETGWDGTYRKKQCDIGTYFWMISYTDRFGNQGAMKGDVVLIR